MDNSIDNIDSLPENPINITYNIGSKEKVRRIKKLPEVLSLEEFKTVLKATRKPHHKLAFKLAFYTGMRIGEVVNLELGDVHFDQGLIYIKRRVTSRAISAKRGRERNVPIPKFIREREWKHIPIKCGVRALEIAFKNVCMRTVGRDLHFHSLRHSFATVSLEKGIPLNQVQHWMGHNKISTTAIYIQVNPKIAKKAYEEAWKNDN